MRTGIFGLCFWGLSTILGANAEVSAENDDPDTAALVPGTLGTTVYRLERAGLVVRIEKKNGQPARLHSRRFGEKSEPGSSSFELPEHRWQALEYEFNGSSFWLEPTEFEKLGLDGETLILEVLRDDGRYHKVRRWSPDGGSFLRLCRFISSLSKPQAPLPGDHRMDPRSTDADAFGSILFRTRDNQGRPLSVRAQLRGAGIEESRTADGEGNFSFDRLVPGYYSLSLKPIEPIPEVWQSDSVRFVRVNAGTQRCFRLLGTQATEERPDYEPTWTMSPGCPKTDRSYGPK